MSDFGLLIGAGLGTGAGIVAGGYLGYKILKKKRPQLLEEIVGDVKQGFSEGNNGFSLVKSKRKHTVVPCPSIVE